jgi:hypothetical protein
MRRLILLGTIVGLLLCGFSVFSAPSASAWSPFGAACKVSKATTAGSPACNTTGADPLIGKDGILYKTSRVLAIIAGVGAVIMIIIGGLMYITAAGDTNKASNARKIIVSASGGLLVIALAEGIIAFAVNVVR